MSRRLITSSLTVSGMTLLSRLLGMVRDAVIAHIVGAGTAADLFLFAHRIPNFLRRLFAEGAFSQAFIPVLTEYRQAHNHTSLRHLVSVVSGTLGSIVLLVTVCALFFSPVVVFLFGFGWFIEWWQGSSTGETYLLAIFLLRITFPYLFFITWVAFSGAILNTLGQFTITAFSPVILNITLIGCALWLSPKLSHPEMGLAIGVFCGGMLQMLFQMPFLQRTGLLVLPRWSWNDAGVVKIRQLMLPALFGVSMHQINLLINTTSASFMTTGTISWLYYADRLLEFPLGLLGVTLSTVLLPILSHYYVQKVSSAFMRTVEWGVRIVLLLGVPATLGLAVLAKPILMVLYLRGAFTMIDLQATTQALLAFNLGLVGMMLTKVLITVYYARQDMQTPVRYGVITMVSNILLNLLAVRLNHIGLALATALASTINAALLLQGLIRNSLYRWTEAMTLFMVRVFIAGMVMVVLIGYLSPPEEVWLSTHFSWRLFWLVGLIIAGIAVYGAVLGILGMRWYHLYRDKRVPSCES